QGNYFRLGRNFTSFYNRSKLTDCINPTSFSFNIHRNLLNIGGYISSLLINAKLNVEVQTNNCTRSQKGVQEVLLSHDFDDVVFLVHVLKPVATLSTLVDSAKAVSRSEVGFEHVTDTNRHHVSIAFRYERNESTSSIFITSSTSVDEGDTEQVDILKTSVSGQSLRSTQQYVEGLCTTFVLHCVGDVGVQQQSVEEAIRSQNNEAANSTSLTASQTSANSFLGISKVTTRVNQSRQINTDLFTSDTKFGVVVGGYSAVRCINSTIGDKLHTGCFKSQTMGFTQIK